MGKVEKLEEFVEVVKKESSVDFKNFYSSEKQLKSLLDFNNNLRPQFLKDLNDENISFIYSVVSSDSSENEKVDTMNHNIKYELENMSANDIINHYEAFKRNNK
ncbi:hypothetical protein [Mammaliicoccus sciuri]|uniref:hypothetical protein n=1 Tax=Mammaliicoccus sciuri TaxID=1296 RepID=UPI001E2C9AA1|nr:hypothetical protein [Mammaliicoccus sciuri]MCD8796493.1 hypothetical protein [Mammaliicoccus sciuri]MCJ0912811.1 hypothetical protein [Mammaliicoccus sciuri]MCJ0941357.1 hypothetical protein [Mammaliicoccus sciuri]MCJ1765517.1 hypothetical protein [Mammaliicoccus sciuri]MCJ1773807.1 hypothetical protein [Mammaliicoccus sciuri]